MEERLLSTLSKRYQLDEETTRALLKDVIEWAHQSAYKKSIGQAVIDSYWEFGEEFCWHLFGFAMEAYHSDESELLTMMQYFNTQMLKRFRPILDKWEIEKKQELEDYE